MNPADLEPQENPDVPPGDDSAGEILPAQDKDEARQERRLKAVYLWFQGHDVKAIARELGVSEPTARADMAYVRQQWGSDVRRKAAYELGKRLAAYDMLKLEFFRAWKLSQTRSVRTGVTGDAEVVTQPGDPRFLTGYRECLDRECKLLGLDSPEKIQIEAPVRLVAGVDLDSV